MSIDYREKIANLTDDQLEHGLKVAIDDLAIASQNEPESDWHQACFAAVLTYSLEKSKRSMERMH